MISLVSPPPRQQHSLAREVVQRIFELSEPGRTMTRYDRESEARTEVDVFLAADVRRPPRPLHQAAKLLTDALSIQTPPRYGNLFLAQAIDACLASRTTSFQTMQQAVQDHWSAWGSIAGVITLLGGQPIIEQRLLAIRLFETLDEEKVPAFAGWFAHPTHLAILENLTSPVEVFLAPLHDAANFLADPEIQEELWSGDIEEHAPTPHHFKVSLEEGELWARAMGLHHHLSLPDLSYVELGRVESFYCASGFSNALEDIIRQTWTGVAPDEAVARGINMLGYALAFSVWEALQTQPLDEVEAFCESMSHAPIADWSTLVSSITQKMEVQRRSNIAS